MIYLLDTNTISFMSEKMSVTGMKVAARLVRLGPGDAATASVLALFELATLERLHPEFGALQARARASFDILDIPSGASDSFARMKIGLAKRNGAKVSAPGRHNFDLLLAATAIDGGCTLVSNDSLFATFAELEPALKLEDWTI